MATALLYIDKITKLAEAIKTPLIKKLNIIILFY